MATLGGGIHYRPRWPRLQSPLGLLDCWLDSTWFFYLHDMIFTVRHCPGFKVVMGSVRFGKRGIPICDFRVPVPGTRRCDGTVVFNSYIEPILED